MSALRNVSATMILFLPLALAGIGCAAQVGDEDPSAEVGTSASADDGAIQTKCGGGWGGCGIPWGGGLAGLGCGWGGGLGGCGGFPFGGFSCGGFPFGGCGGLGWGGGWHGGWHGGWGGCHHGFW